jgi:hypothetical protein
MGSSQSFALEVELLEQVQRRLVVGEDLHRELVDVVIASPPDGGFDQSCADSVTAPLLGDTQADLGWLTVRANSGQIADHLVHCHSDQDERPWCGQAVLQPQAALVAINRRLGGDEPPLLPDPDIQIDYPLHVPGPGRANDKLESGVSTGARHPGRRYPTRPDQPPWARSGRETEPAPDARSPRPAPPVRDVRGSGYDVWLG